jgi:hypothetical protein
MFIPPYPPNSTTDTTEEVRQQSIWKPRQDEDRKREQLPSYPAATPDTNIPSNITVQGATPPLRRNATAADVGILPDSFNIFLKDD